MNNKLFVAEEEEVEPQNAIQNEVVDTHEEEQDIAMGENDGIDVLQVGVDEDEQDDDEDDDPVVSELPLNLMGDKKNLHIFQYVNKAQVSGRKPTKMPSIGKARYQANSSMWELDIPLDDSIFFNKEKIEKDWSGTDYQTLRGVGVENSGQYASFISDGQVYLIPVDSVAQLRPYFKYIDESNYKKKQDDVRQQATVGPQRTQVVTMSVKSVSDQQQNRLTGSLMAHKNLDEEEPIELAWEPVNSENTLKSEVIEEMNKHRLKPISNEQDYLSNLV